MENRTKQEVSIRIKAGWGVFGKYRETFLDRHLTMGLKRKVFNQCVLPAKRNDIVGQHDVIKE